MPPERDSSRLRNVSSKTLNSAHALSLIILPPELYVLSRASSRRLVEYAASHHHFAARPAPCPVRLDRPPPPQRTGNRASISARLRSIMADHERLVSARSSSGVILDWTAEKNIIAKRFYPLLYIYIYISSTTVEDKTECPVVVELDRRTSEGRFSTPSRLASSICIYVVVDDNAKMKSR